MQESSKLNKKENRKCEAVFNLSHFYHCKKIGKHLIVLNISFSEVIEIAIDLFNFNDTNDLVFFADMFFASKSLEDCELLKYELQKTKKDEDILSKICRYIDDMKHVKDDNMKRVLFFGGKKAGSEIFLCEQITIPFVWINIDKLSLMSMMFETSATKTLIINERIIYTAFVLYFALKRSKVSLSFLYDLNELNDQINQIVDKLTKPMRDKCSRIGGCLGAVMEKGYNLLKKEIVNIVYNVVLVCDAIMMFFSSELSEEKVSELVDAIVLHHSDLIVDGADNAKKYLFNTILSFSNAEKLIDLLNDMKEDDYIVQSLQLLKIIYDDILYLHKSILRDELRDLKFKVCSIYLLLYRVLYELNCYCDNFYKPVYKTSYSSPVDRKATADGLPVFLRLILKPTLLQIFSMECTVKIIKSINQYSGNRGEVIVDSTSEQIISFESLLVFFSKYLGIMSLYFSHCIPTIQELNEMIYSSTKPQHCVQYDDIKSLLMKSFQAKCCTGEHTKQCIDSNVLLNFDYSTVFILSITVKKNVNNNIRSNSSPPISSCNKFYCLIHFNQNLELMKYEDRSNMEEGCMQKFHYKELPVLVYNTKHCVPYNAKERFLEDFRKSDFLVLKQSNMHPISITEAGSLSDDETIFTVKDEAIKDKDEKANDDSYCGNSTVITQGFVENINHSTVLVA